MLRSIAIILTLCLSTLTAQASLLGRAALTPSGADYQAYYDDVLNITWLADANYFSTDSFGVTGDIRDGGKMSWYDAQRWITAMNIANHLGISAWRLPTGGPVNGSAVNFNYSTDGSTDFSFNISAPGSAYPNSAANEMAHLFYNTLGNPGYINIDGSSNSVCQNGVPQICLKNIGPFANLRIDADPDGSRYWSGTPADSTQTPVVVFFYFREGITDGINAGGGRFHAWAVADGDPLAPVPLPPAVWLTGSALGVMGVMRRKAAA